MVLINVDNADVSVSSGTIVFLANIRSVSSNVTKDIIGVSVLFAMTPHSFKIMVAKRRTTKIISCLLYTSPSPRD